MTRLSSDSEKLPGVKESRLALNVEYGFQTRGFALLLCIILAALLGLFSNGYFSTALKSNANHTLTVDYERFGRLQTEFKLSFTVSPMNTDNVTVSLGGDFSHNFQPGTLSPQPDRMYSEGKTLYLVYDNVKSKGDFSVWMFVTPTQMGRSVNSIKVNNEPEMTFWQFIYP